MLDMILKAFADYERKYHMPANVLDISHEHFQHLTQEYPKIFGPNAEIELGFHICLHSSYEQPNPAVRKIGCWYEASPEQRAQAQLMALMEKNASVINKH